MKPQVEQWLKVQSIENYYKKTKDENALIRKWLDQKWQISRFDRIWIGKLKEVENSYDVFFTIEIPEENCTFFIQASFESFTLVR